MSSSSSAFQNARSVQVLLPENYFPFSAPDALAALVWDQPGFFWLDSADGNAGMSSSRWSYLSVRPVRLVSCKDRFGYSACGDQGDQEEVLGDSSPLELLSKEWASIALNGARPAGSVADGGLPSGPPFVGGWLALFGYELGLEIENIPSQIDSSQPFPDVYLAGYDVVLAYNHEYKRWWACCLISDDDVPVKESEAAFSMFDKWMKVILSGTSKQQSASDEMFNPSLSRRIRSNCSATEFKANVSRALEFIKAGDIYQVNLSQQFNVEWTESPLLLYQRLKRESPSAYSALISVGDGRWVCSISPELFISVRDGEIETRPIKGTRPRGSSVGEDQKLAQSLETSAKDRAELTMIVDLERNDLGRICRYGTVEVISAGTLEQHPTVFHRTAIVRGQLRPECVVSDLLKATFPGGSITGAPKVRAMEIIEELESSRRGIYCGAVGWVGLDGDLTLNLPIRTALLDEAQQTVWYQAGCGIVADSVPEDEYNESLAKAKAFFRAVNGTFVEDADKMSCEE